MSHLEKSVAEMAEQLVGAKGSGVGDVWDDLIAVLMDFLVQLLEDCELENEQIADRARSPRLLDRIRARVVAMKAMRGQRFKGVSSKDMVDALFDQVGRCDNKGCLEECIAECRGCC